MKKFILILVAALCLGSCVEQNHQPTWLDVQMGTADEMATRKTTYQVIYVPRGQEVIDIAWRNTLLTYMIRPMDDDYVPTTKRVMASFVPGVWETYYVFQESR